MKKPLTFTMLLAVFAASLFFAATAFAVKPGKEVNPNGFPSGEHYNLNLNSKKSDYNCSSEVYDDLGDPVYGKVIFIPQYTSDFAEVGILMESGKKGPKSAPNCTTLEVVDKCAGFDGDEAIMRLPKSESGYNVYLRAKGTPTEPDENMKIFGRLQYVEDENGTPLIFLGTLTQNGLTEPLTRPKGKTKAVDITPLFWWNGGVCYSLDYSVYPSTGLPDYVDTGVYTPQCCKMSDTNTDGVIDSYTCVDKDPNFDCGAETTLLYCNLAMENEWIFNIEAFVEYFWEVDNNGVRSAQVRFYPVAAP
ncbi:MAG: hypothetical protein WBG24_20705 [Syntrophobacteria bacterium]